AGRDVVVDLVYVREGERRAGRAFRLRRLEFRTSRPDKGVLAEHEERVQRYEQHDGQQEEERSHCLTPTGRPVSRAYFEEARRRSSANRGKVAASGADACDADAGGASGPSGSPGRPRERPARGGG